MQVRFAVVIHCHITNLIVQHFSSEVRQVGVHLVRVEVVVVAALIAQQQVIDGE